MNYAEPLSNQVLVFVRSVGFGVILGVVYDVIYTLRGVISRKKWAVIAGDLSFSILGTVLSFFFMVLYNSGQVRLNLIAAQILGAVAFHFTAGRYIVKPILFISEKVRKLLGFIFYPIVFIYRKIKSSVIKGVNAVKNRKPEKDEKPKEKKKIKNILKIPLKK